MGEKLIIGPINKGLRNDRKPFAIDNDSFPTLINAYQWRGRVKRKRGTTFVNRLQRIIGTTDGSGNITVTINPQPLEAGISVFMIGTDIFVDWDLNAGHDPIILITNGAASTHTLNRTTGVLTIVGSKINTNVIYFPGLPVMGLEDFILSTQAFPQTVGFDTTYAYSISPTTGFPVTDISFYKNPTTATYPGYVQKGTPTPTWWNGANYQQFWSTNYQGALWVTNGIDVPFTGATIGMQFRPIITVTVTAAGPPATASLQITGHGLVVGDFVFINEVQTTTGINFETGYVITVTDANNVVVEFPDATIAVNGTLGIAQYLTNRSNTAIDCIRWYDGTGWVNFMPPLSQGAYTIEDNPQGQYYLVGARMIVPFKDRLLFFGPVIQTSTMGASPIYLQDCVVYSQNGTPYYTCSFAYDPPTNILDTSITFFPILTPTNQTATPYAYWEDQFGFGGFAAAGIDQAITTVSTNEDALIIGFNNSIQTRFIYTGNDVIPFQFYIINAELGSSSTFSAITMDEGVITRGPRGFIITAQTSCSRFDLEIPDQVFEIDNTNNGTERFCAQRDFINEWIYFTYPSNEFSPIFPTQTLQYNYRDQSWAIFNETYTTYGTFRKQTGDTWATLIDFTWDEWNAPWNSGESNLLSPTVIAGNTQGYVLIRDTDTTNESVSLYIQNIALNVVTSPNHCLNTDDFITITGALGTVGTEVNGLVFKVDVIDANTFNLNPAVTGTYLGGGQIIRMYIPQIFSKQFPVAWELGRKTRLGPQQYLFTNSENAQVTLLIFLSTDSNNAYNDSPIVPSPASINNSLIYSTVLYTCPESTNLGLSPANVPNMADASNTNLLQLNSIGFSAGKSTSSNSQQQIWHRMNTSLIGDTVQFGFTLSDDQMRDSTLTYQFAEIEFHAAILDLNPSSLLA